MTSIKKDGNEWFGIMFGLMFFKGILASLAGPAPNYDMQRILATRNPREACLMNGMVNVVLYFPRYMMVTGITLLALAFCMSDLRTMAKPEDFERLLPIVLNRYVPVGVVGLLLAGLLAAFMSNFAATLNAAPAYIVNDIYKRFLNPALDAEIRCLVEPSRLDRHPGDRDCLRLAHDPDHRRHDVAGWIVVQRLRDGQRAQVGLVAVQRLRLFLGHDGRCCRGDDHSAIRSDPCAEARAGISCARRDQQCDLYVSAAACALADRLPAGDLSWRAGRRRHSEALL